MTDSGTDNDNQTGEGRQPRYGQYQQPEYGAMSSQFPSGYDPYVYGRPEPERDAQAGSGAAAEQPSAQPMPSGSYQPYQPYRPYQQHPGYPGYRRPGTGQDGSPNGQGRQPRYINGIDVNDPDKNPMYGRWDAYSVIALLCALFFAVPVLPALMGAMSMWRTRTFHMKGFWLGLAAVVLNVLQTILVVWLMMHGMTAEDYYLQLLNMMRGSGAGTGGDGGSLSA